MTVNPFKCLAPWILAVWIVVFIPLFYWMGPDHSFELTNALGMSLFAGTAIGYFVSTMRKLCRPLHAWDSADALTIGVFLGSVGVSLLFVGLWLFRVTDEIYWRDHILFGEARWILVGTALIMMASSQSIDGKIPPKAYMKVGVVSAIAIAIVSIAFTIGYG